MTDKPADKPNLLKLFDTHCDITGLRHDEEVDLRVRIRAALEGADQPDAAPVDVESLRRKVPELPERFVENWIFERLSVSHDEGWNACLDYINTINFLRQPVRVGAQEPAAVDMMREIYSHSGSALANARKNASVHGYDEGDTEEDNPAPTDHGRAEALEAVKQLANVRMNLPFQDWNRISQTIIRTLSQPAAPVSPDKTPDPANKETCAPNSTNDALMAMVRELVEAWEKTDRGETHAMPMMYDDQDAGDDDWIVAANGGCVAGGLHKEDAKFFALGANIATRMSALLPKTPGRNEGEA